MIKKRSLKIKMAINLSVLLAMFIGAMLVTLVILKNTIAINKDITNIYSPSIKRLENLKVDIINSKILINNWVNKQSDNNDPDKIKLQELLSERMVNSRTELQEVSELWHSEEKEKLVGIEESLDKLNSNYETIMATLSDFDSYMDPMVMFSISPMIQEGGEVNINYAELIQRMEEIIAIQNKNSEIVNAHMSQTLQNFNNILIILMILSIVLGIFITVRIVNSITNPINLVKDSLLKMGKGILPDQKLPVGNDEIGEMSEALNMLSDGLRSTVNYAEKIGNGELEATFAPLSEEDVLGNSLLEMGKKLKVVSLEDQKRNWVTVGLAKFAQLMREHQELDVLVDDIIAQLIDYAKANQGAIFLVNDEEPGSVYLEMVSCYAYNRKKFLSQKVLPNEGLVGQCYVEAEIVFLTDVPSSYVKITSGLGEATPRNVVLFPLIVNGKVLGVLEIASFNVLDQYEIQFIEKVCENLAGTIGNIKITQRTIRLLEESKSSQQIMQEKEEELRQNLEELSATQEEMVRKENDYIERISELEQKLSSVEHT